MGRRQLSAISRPAAVLVDYGLEELGGGVGHRDEQGRLIWPKRGG
jgi:hypothetical protein